MKLPAVKNFVYHAALETIRQWWDAGTMPALFIMGGAGTGKTALMVEFITELSCPVFVWDFRQDKSVTHLLKELQGFLVKASQEECLVVLDSLEVLPNKNLQDDYRRYLADDMLVEVLREFAAGYGGCRLMVGCQRWIYEFDYPQKLTLHQLKLSTLEGDAAIDFLRGCEVLGTEAEIRDLLSQSVNRATVGVLAALATTIKKIFNSHAASFDPDNLYAEATLWDNIVVETLNSASPESALDFFKEGSRYSYLTLGITNPNYERGQRVYSAVFDKLNIAHTIDDISHHNNLLYALYDYGLFLTDTGFLQKAEEVLRQLAFYWNDRHRDGNYQHMARQTLAEVLLLQGKLPEAEFMAQTSVMAFEDPIHGSGMLHHLGQSDSRYTPQSGSNPYARRALARALQGKVTEALADFKQAERFQHQKNYHHYWMYAHILKEKEEEGETVDESISRKATLYYKPTLLVGVPALCYADLMVRLGRLNAAAKIAQFHLKWEKSNCYPLLVAHAALILSDVYRLRGEFEQAEKYLEQPIQWSQDSGQSEMSCRSSLAAARLKLAQKQPVEAMASLTKAYEVAAACDFKVYRVDCLVTNGRILLARQHNLHEAEQSAQQALDIATHVDCNYKWGRGNALQLIAEMRLHQPIIYNSKGHFADIRRLLAQAVTIRQQIQDPRLQNTLNTLAKIPEEKK